MIAKSLLNTGYDTKQLFAGQQRPSGQIPHWEDPVGAATHQVTIPAPKSHDEADLRSFHTSNNKKM